ncbi:hypothetical protein [Aquaspirillum soli]
MPEVTNQPLLYQMGLAVGQSVAAATAQVRQEVSETVSQTLDDVTGDYAALARRIRIMRLNDLLGLGI